VYNKDIIEYFINRKYIALEHWVGHNQGGIHKILAKNYSTSTIISLELYALNAEFQHFILRFNLICSYYGYAERGVWGWKEAQKQGDFMNSLNICTYMPPKHLHRAV
jgi:hypothetical protein